MAKKAVEVNKRKKLLAKRKALDAKKGTSPTETTDENASKLPETVIGIKYVRLLEKQLHYLRDEVSQHGNRKLFMMNKKGSGLLF